MTDLRDRIAAVIYEASDEYTRKLMVNPRLPGCSDIEGDCKPVCFTLADAVIRELGKRGAMTDVTWLEIERIGERFGVRDKDIPAFITAVAELVGRKPVEDWHGKATSGGNRVGLY